MAVHLGANAKFVLLYKTLMTVERMCTHSVFDREQEGIDRICYTECLSVCDNSIV